MYRTEKALLRVTEYRSLNPKLLLENNQVLVGKRCVVSHTALKFSKMEKRRNQAFRLRLKHRKPALAPKSPHTTALNRFARRPSLEPTENACHLM